LGTHQFDAWLNYRQRHSKVEVCVLGVVAAAGVVAVAADGVDDLPCHHSALVVSPLVPAHAVVENANTDAAAGGVLEVVVVVEAAAAQSFAAESPLRRRRRRRRWTACPDHWLPNDRASSQQPDHSGDAAVAEEEEEVEGMMVVVAVAVGTSRHG